MKLISKLLAVALGASLSVVSSSAMAEFVTHASVIDSGWRLVDLDLNDGVTPGIQFVDLSSKVSSTYGRPDTGFYFTDERTGTSFDPVGSAISYQNANADAGFVDGTSYASGQLGQGGYVSTFHNFNAGFVLTPHTRLEYFGTASGDAFSDGQHSNAKPFSAYASNIVQLELKGNQLPDGSGTPQSSRYFGSTGVGADSGFNQYTEEFLLGFDNNNAVALNGKFSLSTYAYAVAPSVPEPESYALMLAGLALAGAYARRRTYKQLG